MATFMHFCGAVILKNNLAVLREIEYVHIVRPSNCSQVCAWENVLPRYTMLPGTQYPGMRMLLIALFEVAKRWKQTRNK